MISRTGKTAKIDGSFGPHVRAVYGCGSFRKLRQPSV